MKILIIENIMFLIVKNELADKKNKIIFVFFGFWYYICNQNEKYYGKVWRN